MDKVDKRVRHVAYCLALGVNQLVDKGYTEKLDTIIDKMFNEKLVQYITAKYQDEQIQEFDFTTLSKEKIPKVNKLLYQYGSVISSSSNNCYSISGNGLILLSTVLLHILYDEI